MPRENTVSRRHSIDALDAAIGRLASRMEAACYEQLVLIREFDERAGWLQWSFDNCSDWLAWRCDISLSAAREKVRVAHALLPLPNLSQAFAEGRLSYTKVRALTRVTHLQDETCLLGFALKHTAAQVEERCRELRCGTEASTSDAVRAHERRYLSLRRDVARGSVSITLEVPLEDGEMVEKALDAAHEGLSADDPELAGEAWSAQRADAFVSMVKAYLDGGPASSQPSPRHLVTVHVDRSALDDGRGRSGLPVESMRRIACDARIVAVIEDENEVPLSVGRQSRTVPARIMQALWARDKCCRFPGCNRTRFVDAHHVKHWAKRGETSLDNLMLLCTRHHRAVHEGGFTIRKDFQDQWRFFRPDGIAVPECGYVADDEGSDRAGLSLAALIRASAHPSARGFGPMGKKRVDSVPGGARPSG